MSFSLLLIEFVADSSAVKDPIDALARKEKRKLLFPVSPISPRALAVAVEQLISTVVLLAVPSYKGRLCAYAWSRVLLIQKFAGVFHVCCEGVVDHSNVQVWV